MIKLNLVLSIFITVFVLFLFFHINLKEQEQTQEQIQEQTQEQTKLKVIIELPVSKEKVKESEKTINFTIFKDEKQNIFSVPQKSVASEENKHLSNSKKDTFDIKKDEKSKEIDDIFENSKSIYEIFRNLYPDIDLEKISIKLKDELESSSYCHLIEGSLTQEQKIEIQVLLEDMREEIKQLPSHTKTPQETEQRKLLSKAIRSQYVPQILKILTAQQKQEIFSKLYEDTIKLIIALPAEERKRWGY